MSKSVAKIKYLNTSWRKAKIVVDMIRGKRVDKAIGILTFVNKYIAVDILKLVRTLVNNMDEIPANLVIKEIFVNQGMMMKRMRPGPQGRGMMFRKKTCTVNLKLEKI